MENIFRNLPTLHTGRLTLRKVTENDKYGLYKCFSNSLVMKYLFIEVNKNIEETEKFIKCILDGYENNKPTQWAITLKDKDELIGICGFSKMDYKNRKAEIGYILNFEQWNKGIATEAISKVIEFGFRKLKLNKIEARCMYENIASEQVMLKNGMNLDGILRKEKLYYNKYVDLKLYSILKSDKPKYIYIDENIRLISLDKSDWKVALSWYQDEEILYLSEGINDRVYNLATVYRMYNYLNSIGELYFIQVKEDNIYKTIGDVTLSKENMPIVIGEKKYWGKGIAKKTISKLLERAIDLNFESIYIPEIYLYNERSESLFKSLGFKEIKENDKSKAYKICLGNVGSI